MKPNNLENIASASYWLELNPGLHISDYPFSNHAQEDLPEKVVKRSMENLLSEGYFCSPSQISSAITSRLASAISNVVASGLPAVFAFVYDEYWGLVRQIEKIFLPTLGDNYLLSPGDMWIWHVDEYGISTGWGPHRDLLDTSCLREDGTTRLLTVWIPLTDTSPLNGCMYVLPTHLDPDYPQHLDKRSVDTDTLQYIRALPANAGSLLGWSPTILHWGSMHSGHRVGPRTSIAFYLNDGGDDLGGGVAAEPGTYLPLWYRLGAIGAMISLFDGSPLARDLRFRDELKSALSPYLSRVTQGM